MSKQIAGIALLLRPGRVLGSDDSRAVSFERRLHFIYRSCRSRQHCWSGYSRSFFIFRRCGPSIGQRDPWRSCRLTGTGSETFTRPVRLPHNGPFTGTWIRNEQSAPYRKLQSVFFFLKFFMIRIWFLPLDSRFNFTVDGSHSRVHGGQQSRKAIRWNLWNCGQKSTEGKFVIIVSSCLFMNTAQNESSLLSRTIPPRSSMMAPKMRSVSP